MMAALSTLATTPALAQSLSASEAGDASRTGVSEVIVTGRADRQLLLSAPTRVGSRLNLSIRETPAAVELITEARMLELGARSTTEALNRSTALTASLTPNNPGRLTSRGFALEAVSVLYDGVRPVASASVNRAQDSWLFDRIEVMNGPSSVLYGEGALAGAVNYVTKKPALGLRSVGALASVGSFDTYRLAGDVNLPLSDKAAIRAIGSYGQTGGYIDDTDQKFYAASLGLRLRPSDRLTIDLAADYAADDADAVYYGTPLVTAAVAREPSSIVTTSNGLILDKSLRRLNFAVENPVFASNNYWLRSRVTYQFSDAFTFSNEAAYFDSNQRFENSAAQLTFNRATGLVTRARSYIINDFEFWNERPVLSVDTPIFGNRNRFSIGAEFSRLEARSLRRLGGNHTAVNPYALVRGFAPPDQTLAALPNQTDESSKVGIAAVFLEDAYNITSRWLVVGGLRYESTKIERSTLDVRTSARTSYSTDYDPISWRLGTVYDVAPKTQLFAQYSSAIVPVGAFNLLSLAASKFELSTGSSVEAGLKSTLFDDSLDLTLSAYQIEQDNILTLDPNNLNLTVQGGRRSSRGIEAAASSAITSNLRVDASYTVLDARFDELIEAGGADRKGKTPLSIPETLGNISAVYRFDNVPITVTSAVRYEGRVFLDNANTVRLKSHKTLDASIGYRFAFGDLTLRGRNLTDALYADPVGATANQVTVAPPRSVDLTLTARF